VWPFRQITSKWFLGPTWLQQRVPECSCTERWMLQGLPWHFWLSHGACSTFGYAERHIVVFWPISKAARSWSYNNTACYLVTGNKLTVRLAWQLHQAISSATNPCFTVYCCINSTHQRPLNVRFNNPGRTVRLVGCFLYICGKLVQIDTVCVQCEGEGHRSKFMCLEEETIAKVVCISSSEGFLVMLVSPPWLTSLT